VKTALKITLITALMCAPELYGLGLLAVRSCYSDEIVLKDGRKIEFKTLTDAGETFDVTALDGSTFSVKKSEFDRIAVTVKKDIPLAGATFTFDKRKKVETVDLLARIDPKADSVAGSWKASNGRLNGIGTGDELARVQVPYAPIPEEYDLTLVVERKAGEDNLGIGLVGGGRQFMYYFDVDCGKYSGILAPDPSGHRRVTETPGRAFVVGKSRTVVFMVRRQALIVQVDGKDFATWKADWTGLSVLPQCAVPRKDVLSLSILRSGFEVHRMTLTSAK
jgi:hypothetical protein